MNKNSILIAIIIIGTLVAGALLYIEQGKTEILSSQEAAEKAMDFINQSIEGEGVTASLLDVTEKSNVYKIHLKIEEIEYESYITKDGKLLFPNAFNLEEQLEEEISQEEPEGETSSLDSFAQCLTDKGIKFYGSSGCGYCEKQKEMFGDAAKYLPYIECADEETRYLCEEAEIGPVPAWDFPDGQRALGLQSLEKLAELSGCEY